MGYDLESDQGFVLKEPRKSSFKRQSTLNDPNEGSEQVGQHKIQLSLQNKVQQPPPLNNVEEDTE